MRTRSEGLVVVAILLAASATVTAEEPRLARSIIVPVSFQPCEHVREALLFREETAISKLPGRHVFQFTYFPELRRIEPEFEKVRVEGRLNDEPFRTGVVVTPSAVYVGKSKIDLDLDAQRTRFERNVDARHETIKLTLKCSNRCQRSAVEAAPAATEPSK